jgi:hypothetical protein
VADCDAHVGQELENPGSTVEGVECPLSGILGEVPEMLSDGHAIWKVRIVNAKNHYCEGEDEGYVSVNVHAPSVAQDAV